jgi:hypothetical protein
MAAARAAADIKVMLSENSQGYLWVAEIERGGSRTVTMIPVAREQPSELRPRRALLAIWTTELLKQDEPILDVAVLGVPGEAGARLLVLEPGKLTVYSRNGPGWQIAQSTQFPNGVAAWPRDPRGRLITRPDYAFDAYLPGRKCGGVLEPSLNCECHAGDEFWPLSVTDPSARVAQFELSRNYFTGKIRSPAGEEVLLPFYSAAEIPSKVRPLWAYAGVDGRARVVESGSDAIATIDGWGSDIVGVKTGCSSGWQVLATRSGDFATSDAIQAFEIINRQAVPASAPVEFPGPVTALWAATDGASAIVVCRNLETGKYEASQLSVSCGR